MAQDADSSVLMTENRINSREQQRFLQQKDVATKNEALSGQYPAMAAASPSSTKTS